MLDGEDGREGVRKGVSACSVQGVCDDWSRMRSKQIKKYNTAALLESTGSIN